MLCHWDDVPAVDLARGDLAGRAGAWAPRPARRGSG